jgi:hypothetical protein
MVKRYAGGVISGTKLTPTVLSASGFFNLAEQLQASASNTWPKPIYTFPTTYASLISGFVGTVLYVDSSIGSDNYNGTSYLTPFATVDKAHTVRATISSTNTMIVIRPGTYTVATMNPTTSSSAAFFDYPASLTTYVCAPGKTILNFTSGANRDGSVACFYQSTSAIYGAIINRNNNGKTLNYSTAFFNNTTSTYLGTFYNCVVSEVNANNAWALQYDNAATGSGKATNCSFYNLAAGQASYGGSASFTLTNCAFNYAAGTDNGVHTNDLILSSHNMTSGSANPPYVSPGATNQGVYYGTYAWV